MEDCWVIKLFFDDDPMFSEMFNKTFNTRDDAGNYVNKNLKKFFPFATERTIKKVEINGIIRWSNDSTRIEVRPYRRQ